VKLRFFPSERAGLDILARMAQEVVAAVQALSELLGAAPEDYAELAARVHAHESAAAELQFSLLTQLRSSFIPPLPREDLFALSRFLHEATEKLDAAADLMSLYSLERLPPRASEQLEVLVRQAELTVSAMHGLHNLDGLEDYWIEVLRLARRAERTHRVFVAELLAGHKPLPALRHVQVAEQLVAGTRDMRRVASQVGSIIIQES
jgi:uncharacterized protein Yka (UPF0111/DUF47 family)